jgi:hypothetical protein
MVRVARHAPNIPQQLGGLEYSVIFNLLELPSFVAYTLCVFIIIQFLYGII